MTKKAILTLCLALFAVGAPLKMFSQEKVTVDKIVANVGNSVILYSDVVETEQQLIMQYRMAGYTPPSNSFYAAFEQLLEIKLGYNQALIDSLTVNMGEIRSSAEDEVRSQVTRAGSTPALEAAYNMPIFEIKDMVAKTLEEQGYYRAMRQDVVSKVKITPGEVESYFKSFPGDSIPIVPDQYMYAHITKYPPSMTEAKQRVRERMLQMREELINGTSQFETLAVLYSHDTESAKRGGELDPMGRMEMVEPFGSTVAKLKPGQISEVIETDNGFHLIELLGMVGDRFRVRHIVLTPTYTADEIATAVNQLDSLATKIKQDSITFEQAALRYSDDKGTRMNGGLVTNTERLAYEHGGYVSAGMTSFRFKREDFGMMNYLDYEKLQAMKPGDVSEAYQTRDFKGNTQAKIIKLLEFYPTHEANLAEDYLELEGMALEMKMTDVYNKWLEKTIRSTFIRIDPAYRSGINPKWIK